MTDQELNKDWIAHARNGAIEASKAIMRIYASDFHVEHKSDESPVTIADKTSSKILLEHLSKTGHPIISEEESIPTFEERKDAPYIWIIDPLDGTKEFIKKNGEFCICIALVHNHKSIFGLLASPTQETIIMGGPGFGAYHYSFDTEDIWDISNKLASVAPNPTITIAHSRSHFSDKTKAIIAKIDSEHGSPDYLKKGSALKFMDLALGKADIYPRMAPTMEWDIAAGQAIYEAVGGEVLDFTNFEPLQYNKADLYNPFFIAKHKDLKI